MNGGRDMRQYIITFDILRGGRYWAKSYMVEAPNVKEAKRIFAEAWGYGAWGDRGRRSVPYPFHVKVKWMRD